MMPGPAQRVLAIVPAFNESGAIDVVIRELKQVAPPVDVLVVDDGSWDSTAETARVAGAMVLRLPYNLGIGGAVQTGYRFALERSYDIAIQVDGDGQHIPAEIPALIKPILDGHADMTTGTRFRGVGDFQSSASRRAGIELFARLVSIIVGERVTDTTSGFRAVNRRGIALFAADYPQDYPEVETTALAHRSGLRLAEVPVEMRQRQSGASSITPLRSAYYVIKVTLALVIGLFRSPAPYAGAPDEKVAK
jgi:glycosyltransferase involved in cell wall biosynthesis